MTMRQKSGKCGCPTMANICRPINKDINKLCRISNTVATHHNRLQSARRIHTGEPTCKVLADSPLRIYTTSNHNTSTLLANMAPGRSFNAERTAPLKPVVSTTPSIDRHGRHSVMVHNEQHRLATSYTTDPPRNRIRPRSRIVTNPCHVIHYHHYAVSTSTPMGRISYPQISYAYDHVTRRFHLPRR